MTTVTVPPGGLVDAICEAIHDWGDGVAIGPLRVTPNPLDPNVYLILVGQTIVARLQVIP